MIKEGIILYNIEKDGCLNGVYTNEHKTVNGEIYNEISRIKKNTKPGKDGISGIYDCFYFELQNFPFNAELEIKFKIGNVYEFIWRDLNGTPIHTGVGYKMNDKQIVAHYKE